MDDEPELLGEDVAVRVLNRGGKWQWIQLSLILLTYLSSSQTTFVIVFTGFQPDFTCYHHGTSQTYNGGLQGDNLTGIFDNVCEVFNSTLNKSLTCTAGFLYNVAKDESIVSQWDLVCDKAYLSEVSQLLFSVGSALGAAIMGPLSDRLGRRLVFLVSRALCLVTAYATIFVPGIIGFMVMRFLIGVFLTGTALARGVYITELTPIKIRPFMTTMVGVVWGSTLCVEALIGYLMRGLDWRYVHAVISASFFLVIVETILLKESLLWLYANGKYKEASILLRSAMKTNGIRHSFLLENPEISKPLREKESLQLQEDDEISTTALEDVTSSPEPEVLSDQRKMNLIDMMKNNTTRNLIFIIAASWFVTSLVYYGISLMSSAMTGDRILNFFLIGVVEIPSSIGLYFSVKRLGRRKTIMLCFSVCGVSLSSAGIINVTLDGTTKIIFMQVVTFIGKFGISASFIMLYFYTTELLPTNFRTSGLGIGSFASKIGSFLSPFSSVLLRLFPWGPGVIFGTCCILVTLLFLLVPETQNRHLAQTVIEIENWGKEEKENKAAKKESRFKTV